MKYLSFFIFFCLIFGQFWIPYSVANEDPVPGSRFTSARGAAMGEAYEPLADDGPSALFYNPASLTKIRKTDFELMNLSLYGNAGWLTNSNGTSFFKITSLSSYQSTLASHPGVLAGTGAQYVPSFYTKGFAFGLLLQSQTAAVQNADGSIHYRSTYQLIPTAGTGIKLANGIVRLGYSLQYVNEAVGDVTVPASGTGTLGYNQGLAQGSALSHTLGATITMPWQYLPSASLVARNVGGTHYSSNSLYQFTPNSTGAPATENMSLDSAFMLQPKLGNGSYWNLVAEYRDMTNSSGIDYLGRIAFGSEFALRDSIFLRAGWGSGYPSAGLGVKTKKGELSLTWYSEELGTSYHDLRDQRFMLQYSVKAF
jgi:hypothetical protein